MDRNDPRLKQFGTLHERMKFVMERAGDCFPSHTTAEFIELWHALWDLKTLVENTPDHEFTPPKNMVVRQVKG